MTSHSNELEALLARSIERDRVHSAYLLSGPGPAPRDAALTFVRGLVCAGDPPHPCEACAGCRRSAASTEIEIDGTGRGGPLLRHVGDHPDLLWVERGREDTRVRIGQIRALQSALRLRGGEGGRRAAVVADAEWLNQEAQNALLRLLEEPPPRTTLVLVAASSAALLATVRSRCQRVPFRPGHESPLDDPENAPLRDRLDGLAGAGVPDLLDWAEEYRGARARAAEGVQQLLDVAGSWIQARVSAAVRQPRHEVGAELEAFRVLAACRRSLAQRNANPQMVAERALLALRGALTR